MYVNTFTLSFIICIFLTGCKSELLENNSSIDLEKIPFALDFREPVGNPPGKGYYDAQSFGKNKHLGEDWNGIGGGNTDFGDTIYAIANGYVIRAKDFAGGWGNVVTILHKLKDKSLIESLYAHGSKILVKQGSTVKKGEPIALIGDANGQYLSHLHFEIRRKVNQPIGGGYGNNTNKIYLNPREVLKK